MNGTRHLGYDITCPANHDPIPRTDILTTDFILVVQRCIGYRDPADKNRLQPRDRCQGTGTPYLHVDIKQSRDLFFGRKFMRQRPAWRLADKAQHVLLVKAVHLVHHAVYVITEVRPQSAHARVVIKAALQAPDAPDFRVDRAGLERDLKRILTRYYGLPIYEIDAQEVSKAIQPILYEYKLYIPTDYYLLMKTVIMMQGVGLRLDPDFDIFEAAQPYIGKLFRRMWLPSSWGQDAVRLALDWKDFATLLPRKTSRILEQVERGQLTIQAELPQLEPTINAIDRLINRIIFSVLVAALVVALAMLLPRLDYAWPWSLVTWIILIGFFVLLFLAIRLAWSVFRSGRSKFD